MDWWNAVLLAREGMISISNWPGPISWKPHVTEDSLAEICAARETVKDREALALDDADEILLSFFDMLETFIHSTSAVESSIE